MLSIIARNGITRVFVRGIERADSEHNAENARQGLREVPEERALSRVKRKGMRISEGEPREWELEIEAAVEKIAGIPRTASKVKAEGNV